jgi:hypothetical protein
VLLLVLILVLIAFGLLVVALLSGSVLWAWVSVGVSVAAAAVLLVDWLQRRSAVRAGAEAGDVATPLPPVGSMRPPAVEPATEVLPAVVPGALHGGDRPDESGRGRGAERPEVQETLVLRAATPSGSKGGPPGAPGGIGPAGPDSSPSVTTGEGDGAAAERPERPGAPGGEPAKRSADPEATLKVAGSGASGPAEPERADAAPRHGATAKLPSGVAEGAAPERSRPDLLPLGPDGAPPVEPHDAEAAGAVAELDDEVLVVDELPRYHLGGCRSLAGSPVIPLAAREAVELGFTPCAWCTPDRVLSARHRAPVR